MKLIGKGLLMIRLLRLVIQIFFFIDFATNESEKFALELYGYIEEIDDDELNSIFTIEFLREITKSWWIIPRLNLDD